MEDIALFFEMINKLDEPIKTDISEMVNSDFIVTINKNANFSNRVNEFLNKIDKIISTSFGSAILYIVGELSDNIEQHSEYSNAYLFLKQNLKEEIVKILIYDDGLTIPLIFDKNSINFSEDNEAIKMALMGTTTKKEDISRGFGLSSTKKIVNALKRKIQIISRRGFLEVENSRVKKKDLDKEIRGTLIFIKLKTPEKDLNIYPYLE